jgi:hypothetical protein
MAAARQRSGMLMLGGHAPIRARRRRPRTAKASQASKHRVRLAMDHVHDHDWVVLGLCLITVAFFGFILWHQQTVVLPERNRQLRAERAKNRIEKLA